MAEAISKRINVLTPAQDRPVLQPSSQAADGAREMNRNLVFLTLGVAVVFIACSLFYVWSHHQIVSLGYETSQAAREEQQLLRENEKLRLEVAALKAPGRIERMARQELGLVAPQKEQLIIVR